MHWVYTLSLALAVLSGTTSTVVVTRHGSGSSLPCYGMLVVEKSLLRVSIGDTERANDAAAPSRANIYFRFDAKGGYLRGGNEKTTSEQYQLSSFSRCFLFVSANSTFVFSRLCEHYEGVS